MGDTIRIFPFVHAQNNDGNKRKYFKYLLLEWTYINVEARVFDLMRPASKKWCLINTFWYLKSSDSETFKFTYYESNYGWNSSSSETSLFIY